MEWYGMSLGKRRSPWNVVEEGLVSMGYMSGRFQKGYKARKREGKRLGLWWALVASTVFQSPRHHQPYPALYHNNLDRLFHFTHS